MVGAATWPHEGYSAYERTVQEQDLKKVDLSAVPKSAFVSSSNLYDPTVPDAALERALEDVDHKVSADFQVPDEIKASVKFWMRVYTQYSTQHIVIFDANNMNTIFEVLDFRELAETARNPVVYEIVSNNKIKKTIASYKSAFAALAKNPHPKHPTREETIILSKVKNPSRKALVELGAGLKYIRGQRDNLMSGLLAAESFLPKMEMIFAKMKVPVELTRLSLVESSFNLRATSKCGASGVWQFMPAPGKKFMTIDDEINIDERRSPLKSTVAAAKMLYWNYHYLGSWALAVISYNHGLKNLPRLKGKDGEFTKIAHLFDPKSKVKALGWASRSYYSEFLAALYAETYRNLFFGEVPSSGIRPIAFEQLTKDETALSYAMEKVVPLEEFRFLNADIEDIHQVLPKGFWVAVPSEADNINGFVALALGKDKSRKIASHHHHHSHHHSHHEAHQQAHPHSNNIAKKSG